MKLALLDGGVIYVNPAHVIAVEEIQNEDEEPIGAAVIMAATVASEDEPWPTPLTAEVDGTAEEVAKSLGLAYECLVRCSVKKV